MKKLLICLGLLLVAAVAQAQEAPPTCLTDTDELFVRDDYANASLTLMSWRSGDTLATLESGLPFSSYQFVDWSPGCHYALAGVDGQILAWDTQAGVRLSTLDAAPTPRTRTHWSPDNSRLVIQTQSGGYLWQMGGEAVLLDSVVDGYGRSFFSTEWDTQRNELLTVQVSTPNGVTAYNLDDGQQAGFFHIGERRGFVEYRRIEDNQTIFVYSSNLERLDNNLPFGLALWSRVGSRQMQMDLPDDVGPSTSWLGDAELAPFVRNRFDLVGGLNTSYFAANHIGSDAPYVGVWRVILSAQPIDPVVDYYWYNDRQIQSHVDYVRLTGDYLDIADYGWRENSIRVERISLSSGETVHASRNFHLNECSEQASQENAFADLYGWACNTPPPSYLAKRPPFPNREYQNGENNAVIWTQR